VGNAESRMKKRGHSELVVFGRRAVLEALAQPDSDVEVCEVWVVKSTPGTFRSELAAACRKRALELRSGSLAQVNAFSGEPKHDQGVAARIRLGRIAEVESFLEARKGKHARAPMRLLALDGVTNSQNIGMAVRTLVGCQLDGLIWPAQGSPWINGLVIKASASAIYRCNVLCCDTLSEGLIATKRQGFELVGLAHPADGNLFEYELPHRAVFVVGSETLGLSDDVMGLLDQTLEIPLAGPVESLNVAVAASLACYKAAGIVTA